jgi:quinohemoprotein ethanol dehydrogenase
VAGRKLWGMLAACLLLGAGAAPASDTASLGAGSDWLSHGGGVDEASFSRLAAIDTRSVKRLGLAWSLDLDAEASLQATPLAVNGMLYFTGSRSTVYAVDGASGKLLWFYDPEIWRHNPEKQAGYFGANRGVAYDNGMIFSGVLDGRLVALDARTGKLKWSVETLPPGPNRYNVSGAPRTFNGKVIIGNGGGDMLMRGFVTAYDQATGKQAWRFYTVPGSPEENRGDPVMEMAARTWGGEYWKVGGGGGTVWHGMTFDPELARIYIGTSNGGPYNPRLRSPGGGDNLFLTSIVALDASTGKYVWHYQVNPGESWDYKATANMIATTLTIGGRPRKVLMQAPTNGFFYVLDRETGKLISAEKIGKVTWAERIDLATGRPVEAPGIRYEDASIKLWPGFLGAHNWQDMAYNPKSGLVYIPTMQMGGYYSAKEEPGHFFFNGATAEPYVGDGDNTGALLAWDPVAQKARWKVPLDTLWNGGALATAGNLVFQGTADGWFTAYDALTGKRLWRFDAGFGIVAAPMSYEVGGRQYVSVLVGYGGTTGALSPWLDIGWKYNSAPRRLLTFALGGKARLPKSAGRDFTVHALDDPAVVLDPASVKAGEQLGMMCGMCHGMGMRSSGSPAPDLRESAVAMSEDALWSVLHDGALAPRGMPAFPALTRAQVRNLQDYIRQTARDALNKQQLATAKTGAVKN